jgi:hypothetical protein
VVYLQESGCDCGINDDPILFSHTIDSDNSNKWIDAVKDELKSIEQNKVWDLIKILEGCKRVGCKWVFMIK